MKSGKKCQHVRFWIGISRSSFSFASFGSHGQSRLHANRAVLCSPVPVEDCRASGSGEGDGREGKAGREYNNDIIMYICHALVNALSAHVIRINLNMIFLYTCRAQSYQNSLHKVLY